ncbi:MAG: hypothetical protein A3D31_17100 [Candidatus Fluviicola riflensis]|nr:MAG: hypothetical protein A3D31_17100 [Candidatus Fluviicola riflensis]
MSFTLQAETKPATPPKVKTDSATVDSTKQKYIRVLSIRKYREDLDFEPNSYGNNVYPGDYIMVKIDRRDLDSARLNMSRYRLWIDGICFPNMKPHFINDSEPALIFQLERDTAETSPWQLMYSNPNYWKFHHRVNVNMGTLTKEYHNPDKKHQIILYTTIWWIPWVFYPLFILLVILIIKYGRAFLKDTSLYASNGVKIGFKAIEKTDAATGVINIREIPYSLARFQFLLWLIVIFFGILHIWIITDVLTSPTGSTLLLLGISGGTFYLGRIIDKPAGGGTLTATEAVTQFETDGQHSKGLMFDMLNDGKSISLHRLQLLLFTVFLSCYFVMQVVGVLIMPQFDDTMLALMGISSTMYAGVKTTEA